MTPKWSQNDINSSQSVPKRPQNDGNLAQKSMFWGEPPGGRCSDTGVVSANKFLQKIWNLNYQLHVRNQLKIDDNVECILNNNMHNHGNFLSTTVINKTSNE